MSEMFYMGVCVAFMLVTSGAAWAMEIRRVRNEKRA